MNQDRLQHLLFRGCRSKRRFNLSQVNKEVDEFAKNKVVMYFYQCVFCAKYHLTSSPPNEDLNQKMLNAIIEVQNNMEIRNRRKRPCKKRR